MSDVLQLQEDPQEAAADEKNSNVSYLACAGSNASLLLCQGF